MNKFLKNNKNVIILTMAILLVLSIIKKVYIFEVKFKEEKNIKIRCMVIEKKKESEDKVSYLVKYDKNRFLLNIYEYESKDLDYEYGDVIEFRGNINKIKKMGNPYEFNYKLYLNSNNIVSTITATNSIKYVSKVNGNIILKLCFSFKKLVFEKIDKKLKKQNAELFKSMIYGQSQDLNEEIKEVFKKDGLSYILVVSGTHLMYLISFIDVFLKESNFRKKKYIYYVIILFYIVISGLSVSSIRAGIMSLISISNKKINKLFSLFLSLVFLVIINPYVIFSVSAIMTYLSAISIIKFNSLVFSLFKVKIKVPKYSEWLFKILSTTISSLVLLFPVQIYYFGEFELRTFFSAVLTCYINSFILLLSFITFFLMFVPIVSQILFNSLNVSLHIYTSLLKLISIVEIDQITLPRPSVVEMYMYYLSVLLLCTKKYTVFIIERRIKKFVRVGIKVFVIASFVCIISSCIYRIYFEEYIVYFNVGQGNMALIRKNRKVIVVDIGSTSENTASNTLNIFLKAKAIEKIDLVLLTHMHTDHINGIYNLDVKVEKVGYSLPKEDSKEYENIQAFLLEEKIPRLELKKGDNLTFDGLQIDILLPYSNETIKSSDIPNANSMVVNITIGDENYLFMGDSTIETEKKLLENNKIGGVLKNITILQVGHHGSDTSTSDLFLKNIKVKLALISSKKNIYGHPSKDTLEKLEKYNIKYHITEKDGALMIKK